MKRTKKIISSCLSAICVLTVMSVSAYAANPTFSNLAVTGTGYKTVIAETASINSLDLYVTTCNFSTISKGNLEYNLFAPYFSETQYGTTGTYSYVPYNGTSKNYILDAHCQNQSAKASISGNYNIVYM